LRELLYQLSVSHLIAYIPKSHADIVTLHHVRLEPGALDLQPERYALLKKNNTARAEAMLEYVSETDTCRSKYLLKYFGQEKTGDCGSCDVCRSRKKESGIEEKLMEFVNGEKMGDYTLLDIKGRFAPPGEDSEACLEVLRRLIDSGKVPPYRE
jgi:ATP-dependent DNA helicase RecQ